MDKYKTKLEKLGWEIKQIVEDNGSILYVSTKGPKIAMSHDLFKLYHGCMFMETIKVPDEVEEDPFKDLIVKEPPVTIKKKKMLKYFKFKLNRKDKTYVNEDVKIGLSISDVNTISDQKLFRTLDVLVQADKVSNETFSHLLKQLNSGSPIC